MRGVAMLLGAWAVVLLVDLVGPDDVLVQIEALTPALGWLFLLEMVRLGAEIGATATQLGRYVRPLGARRLVRGHLLSYATSALAPAGRVAGEVIKAAYYSPMLGRPIAAALAVRIQAASLFAGGAMSAVCAVAALSIGAPPWLSIGLIAHTALAGFAGGMLTWAGRRSGALKNAGRLKLSLEALEKGFRTLRASIVGPVLFLFLGRFIQVAEMAVLLSVLSRAPTLVDSLVMEGVFMIGTAAGDLIPAQLGATDAAFTFGASSFAVTASQGLAIAAAIHIVQLGTSIVCSIVALLPAPSRRTRFSPISHLGDTSEARKAVSLTSDLGG